MASIGEIGAKKPKQQEKDETEELPLAFYFGVFFDGTSNNMVQKETAKAVKKQFPFDKYYELKNKDGENFVKDITNEDGLIDINLDNAANPLVNGGNEPGKSKNNIGYSNVAILHNMYVTMSDQELKEKEKEYEVHRFNIYVEGAGTEVIWKKSNWIDKARTGAGSIAGRGDTGIINLVSKAIKMVNTIIKGFPNERLMNPKTEIHFDVFGFSRGSACARFFSYMAAREKGKTLPCENKFKFSYASSTYDKSKEQVIFLDPIEQKNRKVDFLGIYETVSATGRLSVDTYLENNKEYGLYSPSLPNVLHTFHIMALDEYRAHFGVTDIGDAANKENNGEILIPGCHSDVGGGYIDEVNEFYLKKDSLLSVSTDNSPTRIRLFINHPTEPFDINNAKPLNEETLRILGWLGHSEKVEKSFFLTGYRAKQEIEKNEKGEWIEDRYKSDLLRVKRYVLSGYCSIPLLIMKKRAESDLANTRRHMFYTYTTEVPPEYRISEELKKWEKEFVALHTQTGRRVFMPGGSYSSSSYRELRSYLHFTSKESLGFDPSYDGQVISRFLYHGNPGDNERHHLTDYNMAPS